MERNCRNVKLSNQPLVLVLCQVRFSLIRKMVDYLPAIQEVFRRNGFPIERSGKVRQFSITPGGVIQSDEQERWEYLTKDEAWSILLLQDSVTLQTTDYQGFEDFADKLRLAVDTVLVETEHVSLGRLQRIGLRYVDLIRSRDGEDFRYYLRPGLHGVADDVFCDGTHRVHVECVGETDVGGEQGAMIIRVVQNDQGMDLPPDIIAGAPKREVRAEKGQLATLVDMDHYLAGNFDADVDWIMKQVFGLHDHIIETFHEHVVTPEALEVWK